MHPNQDLLSLPPLPVIALNRAAYGPQPGSFDFATFTAFPGATDAEKMAAFVDWQLNPGAIDDSACDARIAAAGLTTLNKTLKKLWTDHHEAPGGDRTLPVEDVRAAALLRAVYSRRQLYEVLVNFWHNHFNIYAWDYAYASPTWVHYDRDVIRANALGNFRQMLEAVATSPAMLFYLDNYINQSGGPNENWAREVFELHTMGAENYLGVKQQSEVEGYPSNPVGYVDADVFEATRCFTGWRVSDGQWPLTSDTGEFLYYDSWHDHFQKTVLGRFIPANGAAMSDGQQVLDLLAAHPGTARFIARKLCRRLIADEPPQTVVDAAAAEFSASLAAPDQIKRVVRVILLAPEFAAAWGEKIKQPYECVVSMLRAVNASFNPTDEFFWNFDDMQQPMYERRPPDGYPDTRDGWTNTTGMLARWQMALTLTENWIDQAVINVSSQTPPDLLTANAIVDYWINRILGRPMSTTAQRARIVDFMRGPYSAGFALNPTYIAEHLPRMVALLLMSPDFQYR